MASAPLPGWHFGGVAHDPREAVVAAAVAVRSADLRRDPQEALAQAKQVVALAQDAVAFLEAEVRIAECMDKCMCIGPANFVVCFVIFGFSAPARGCVLFRCITVRYHGLRRRIVNNIKACTGALSTNAEDALATAEQRILHAHS